MGQLGLELTRSPEPPDQPSPGAYSVLLNWAEGDTVRIGIGRADGSLLVSGSSVFDALVDLCLGEAWALVAGNVCIARQNAEVFLLRVLEPRLSITIGAGEFRDAVDQLGADRHLVRTAFAAAQCI